MRRYSAHLLRSFLSTLFVASLALPALAHHDEEEHQQDSSKQAVNLPAAMALPALDGPTPWSDKPVLNDADRFHIAIMTDRTGGHRPGIWMKGVRAVNMLRPEFVVSVGDLIEGYTMDKKEIERQWNEFLGFIDQMDMRFFFVAGNHDLSNHVMHKIWREHFGPEWYSFDYKGVHFVCLCSEDPVDHIGDKQLAWIEDDLEKHRDARWTLLFMHKPLWLVAERALKAGNPDKTNWKKVEALLGSRPHTVFAGHVHHYVQYDRNGTKYYHLATTGGGSALRGVPYGEFDHVTWLTMEKDGPHIAHLLLDGVVAPDAVTEEGIARFRAFLAKASIEVAPILIGNDQGLSQGRIDLRLRNGFDQPVELRGTIDGLPLRGLTVEPEGLVLKAEPGQTAELAVNIRFNEVIDFPHLAQTVLTAKIRTLGDGPPLSAEKTVPVVIDRRFECPRPAETIVVDGNLNEWGELPYATAADPLVLGNRENWTGPDDASARFAVASDDRYLYLAASVSDERVLPGEDAVEWILDPRPIQTRKADGRIRRGGYRFLVGAADNEQGVKLRISGQRDRQLREAVQSALRRTDSGYDVELAIPIKFITKHQGPDWQSVQLTLVVHDADDAGQPPARIVWRGTNQVDQRNTNYGHFVRSR